MPALAHERSVSDDGNTILDIYYESPSGSFVEAIVTRYGCNRPTVSYRINSDQPPVCEYGPDHNFLTEIQLTAESGHDVYISPRFRFTCLSRIVMTDVNNSSGSAQAKAVAL